LQRALTDFGAEESFTRAAARVKEHYGIEVPISAVRHITYDHARSMEQTEPRKAEREVKILITQMDGSMIPLVQSSPSGDRRKNKMLLWNEARLCCARSQGEQRRVYGATLGSLEATSLLWQQTAQRAGLSEKTFVHGIGDGAPWIVEKFQDNFGRQGRYLIDFYHVSEYLAAAAAKIAGDRKAVKWLHKQKGKLLNERAQKILKTLSPHLEPQGCSETPVRDAFRYIQGRQQHLHYLQTREAKLPIGSGEVESGHRHVVQQRLKIAGAWWKQTNAQRMLNLRVCRANDCWTQYWTKN
jgi:hypothetical protein